MLHDAFLSQQEQFADMISAYPPELMAAFGGTADLFSPTGFLNFTYFSYVSVLLGFLAISMGSALLAQDEERGRLELLAAYPVSRLGIFAARLLAVLFRMVVILFLSWLGFVLFMPATGLAEVSAWQMTLPHLELLAFMFFFTGLALLLSQVLPARNAATAIAAAYLLAGYVIQMMLELDESLAGLERFSALHVIKGGYAIEGLNPSGMLSLLGFGLLFTVLAAWRFHRRDLRVSGEGSWPSWLRSPMEKNQRAKILVKS
jgi:ABC-2 type transport system permease protein